MLVEGKRYFTYEAPKANIPNDVSLRGFANMTGLNQPHLTNQVIKLEGLLWNAVLPKQAYSWLNSQTFKGGTSGLGLVEVWSTFDEFEPILVEFFCCTTGSVDLAVRLSWSHPCN